MEQYKYDVAIITAVKIETDSIRRCFKDWKKVTFENDSLHPDLLIKSICDYASNEKSDQYQKFAAYTSSEFAKWLMENKLSYD